MTKLVLSADWHGELPSLPAGDILIVAGDIMPVWNHSLEYQQEWADEKLPAYFRALTFKHILLVGGNHDFLLQKEPVEWRRSLPENVTYLQDSGIEIITGAQRLSFWGAPWSNLFGTWAFMLEDNHPGLSSKWELIPNNTDVLIVHGPPYGLGDRTEAGNMWPAENVGSRSLRDKLEQLQPKLVITGHIHEAYGSYRLGQTDILNVSLMDLDYSPVNPAVEWEL